MNKREDDVHLKAELCVARLQQSGSAAQKGPWSQEQLQLGVSQHEWEYWNPSFPEQGKVMGKHMLLTS